MNQQSCPNVVFILTGDQGYGDMFCLGNPILQTSHLDNVYIDSVRCTAFHLFLQSWWYDTDGLRLAST